MQRDFKGVWIPKELWLLKDLNLTEKVMLIEIDSLDNENGCFATNDYFAEFFNLSKGRISKIINNLVRRGFITSEIKYQKGTRVIEKRILKISCWYGVKNSPEQPEGMVENNYPYSQMRPQPIVENVQDNKLNNKLNYSLQIFEEPKTYDINRKKKKVFDVDSDAYLLARLLENEILKNNPNFLTSEKQRQTWAKDIDLMVRRDNLDSDDIAEVIIWCQQDRFWQSNILSGKKLREKYQQLRMKTNEKK